MSVNRVEPRNIQLISRSAAVQHLRNEMTQLGTFVLCPNNEHYARLPVVSSVG